MTPLARRGDVAGLLVVGLGAAIAPLDFAVNVAFPAMTQAFALQTHSIRWFAICYVLTYGSLMLGFGALGDRVGHLRVFRAGLLLGIVSMVLCAMAPGYPWLLAARVVQGIAVSLTLSCAPALATLVVDERRRTWALSWYSSFSALAAAVAPLAGGIFVTMLDWPGVFWFRLPVALLALACLPVLQARLHPATALDGAAGGPPAPAAPGARPAFDVTGSVLLAAGVALLLLGPSLLGPGRGALAALSVAATGGLLMAAFVRRQRSAPVPYMPPEVARDKGFRLLNVGASVVHFSGFAVLLVLPFYLLRGGGWTPVGAGAMVAAWAIGTTVGSAVAERLVRAIGAHRAATAGVAASFGGTLAMVAWPDTPDAAPMAASLLLQGIGLGLFQVAYTDLVVAALPRSARGVAGSLSMVTRTVGVVLGATVWLWLLQVYEEAAITAGLAPRAAFMAGFRAVVLGSAAVAGTLVALVVAGRALRR